MMLRLSLLLIAVWSAGSAAEIEQTTAPNVIEVEAKRKPDARWRAYTVVPPGDTNQLDWPEVSRFGGRLDQQLEATGFFRVQKRGDRWVMADPLGHPLIRVGVNSVYRRWAMDDAAGPDWVTDDKQWANRASDQLRSWGFNALGRWSEVEALQQADVPLPFVSSLKFMAAFGRSLELTYAKPGHAGYRDDCIPVFHPKFEAFCDEYARKHVAPLVEDPWLVGHYTDNESPVPADLLDRTLAIEEDNQALRHNRDAAWQWLRARHGEDASFKQITDRDRADWLGVVMKRYYRIVGEAVRRHDPNHLLLGSRLHSRALRIEPIIAAAGLHVDVISFNVYNVWQLSDQRMQMWRDVGKRPFIVSEFYVKAEASGLENESGAGWIVRTQRDRGMWYNHFVLTTLKSGGVVGFDFFKYRDDPDSNKGLLTHDFEPYDDFVDVIKQTNHAVQMSVQVVE